MRPYMASERKEDAARQSCNAAWNKNAQSHRDKCSSRSSLTWQRHMIPLTECARYKHPINFEISGTSWFSVQGKEVTTPSARLTPYEQSLRVELPCLLSLTWLSMLWCKLLFCHPELAVSFYADNGRIAQTNAMLLQVGLDLLTAFFACVGIKMNASKMKAMIGHNGNLCFQLSTLAYKRCMSDACNTHCMSKCYKVSCPHCNVTIQLASLYRHMYLQHNVLNRPTKRRKLLEDAPLPFQGIDGYWPVLFLDVWAALAVNTASESISAICIPLIRFISFLKSTSLSALNRVCRCMQPDPIATPSDAKLASSRNANRSWRSSTSQL